MVILLPRCLFYYQDGCSRKILPSNSHTLTPDSRFPIPDSRFPIPDSRFPIPLFKTKNPNSWGFSIGITTFVKKVSPRQASSKNPTVPGNGRPRSSKGFPQIHCGQSTAQH
ncbi:MAG: hypothetical protein F6J90_22570 [Moorea sp. SIOASIH]|uniref:hypothetical protein n=1 Tax=Moorena sp. SIOASIH TaxID=2607817 RepID=UPI0013BBE071|nr:hypothetical protein [Moorena sp. SIOASIH]NEO38966.1 hypothetical protein [Moorena sp. SIOASIH]